MIASRRLVLAAAAGALLAACAPEGAAPSRGRREIVVSAAASTRDALAEIAAFGPDFAPDLGCDVVFNYGSSGDLARQIVAGAKVDVFLSADEVEMDRVGRAGLLVEGTRSDLLGNRLVVVEPADRPSIFAAPFRADALGGDGVRRLSLGDPSTVPAGRYAKAWLERAGVWESLAARVVPAVDVRAALAAVAAGAADVGVVYATDAATSSKVRVVHAVPFEEAPRIRYPVAIVAGRPESALARAFLARLRSPAAAAVFARRGFDVVPVETAGGR